MNRLDAKLRIIKQGRLIIQKKNIEIFAIVHIVALIIVGIILIFPRPDDPLTPIFTAIFNAIIVTYFSTRTGTEIKEATIAKVQNQPKNTSHLPFIRRSYIIRGIIAIIVIIFLGIAYIIDSPNINAFLNNTITVLLSFGISVMVQTRLSQ